MRPVEDNKLSSVVGPGYWSYLHSVALAMDFKSIRGEAVEGCDMLERVKELCRTFPCPICAGHCEKYLKSFPPPEEAGLEVVVYGKALRCNMFYWTWMYHNAVSRRIGKEELPFSQAYKFYRDLLKSRGL